MPRPLDLTDVVKDVGARIGAGAALIEFVRYRRRLFRGDRAKRWAEHRYAAYVLLPSYALDWYDFGPAATIDALVRDLRQTTGGGSREAFVHAARALDQKVMRRIREQLGSVRDLLVAPDGALNLVPFGALPDEKGHSLLERYRVTYLASGCDGKPGARES